jgi:hypothetical protein
MSIHPRVSRRVDLLLFTILFVTYGYFYQAGGWGQNARMALTRAIIERCTFQIDAYEESTGDKAKRLGHYYSDKAPGVSLFGLPGYWLGVEIARTGGAWKGSHTWMVLTTYSAQHLSVALLASLLGLWICRFLVHTGVRLVDALLTSLMCCVGTIVFPYATLFHGHVAAAAFLFGCFYHAFLAKETAQQDGLRTIRLCLLSGFLGGMVILTEYPPLLIVGVIFVYLVGAMRGKLRAVWFLAGAAPPVVLLMIYNTVCYGGPFSVGYSMVTDDFFSREMGKMFFGIRWPHPEAMWGLTFGTLRGLFVHSPIALVGAGAVVAMAADRSMRAEAILFGASFVYLWLLISAYPFWNGGAAFGARHLVPTIPFLAAPIGYLLGRRQWLTGGILVVAGVSLLFAVAAAAVNPEPTDEVPRGASRPPTPLAIILPAFARGQLSVATQSYDDILPHDRYPQQGMDRYPDKRRFNAFNLGELAGLRGLASLVPLGLFCVVALFLLRKPLSRAC